MDRVVHDLDGPGDRSPEEEGSEPRSPQAKPPDKRLLYIPVVAVLVLIAVLAFFMLRQDQDDFGFLMELEPQVKRVKGPVSDLFGAHALNDPQMKNLEYEVTEFAFEQDWPQVNDLLAKNLTEAENWRVMQVASRAVRGSQVHAMYANTPPVTSTSPGANFDKTVYVELVNAGLAKQLRSSYRIAGDLPQAKSYLYVIRMNPSLEAKIRETVGVPNGSQ